MARDENDAGAAEVTALITVKSGQTFYLLDATGEAIEAASVGAVRVEVWP